MKKILLGLFFAMFAFQVSAATMSWETSLSNTGLVIDKDNSSTLITSHVGWDTSINTGSTFNVDFVFNIEDGPQNTNASTIEYFDVDLDIATVTMDGIAGSFLSETALGLTKWSLSPALVLQNGNHTIRLVVNSVLAGAQVSTKVSAVPVPAAVWLFGSALMGLVGVSRRKSTAVAA